MAYPLPCHWYGKDFIAKTYISHGEEQVAFALSIV